MTFARNLQLSVQHTVSSPPPPPPSSYLMGVSNSTNDHGGFANWDAWRVYDFSKVNAVVSSGAQIIALTDKGTAAGGGATSANALDSALTTIFNAHPNIEIHWANGNEIDTEAIVGNYVNTCALMKQVIDDHKTQGHKVSMWIDLTAYPIRNSPFDIDFKPVAPYLDGIACSMYPPGRTKNPLQYTDYDTFITPVFDLAVDWGVAQVSCWETGIGPDTNTSHTTATNETATSVKVRKYGQSSLTTITLPNAKQVRPTYAAYMAKYIVEAGQAYGIPTPILLWWDSQKSGAGNPDNILSDDPSGTSPSTALSWKNWPTYVS